MKKLFTLLALLFVTWSQAGATNILGQPQISAEQAYQYIKKTRPDAQFTREMAQAYINIGKKMGLRGDIAICQSIWETSWFTYTGGTAVTASDHNYCGLGVTKKGYKGCQFKTVEEGVTAQFIHLWGYATTESLPAGFSTSQDPRWSALVSSGKRGCSPTWEGLGNGHWAAASGYGTNIIGTWNNMKAYRYTEPKLSASETTFTITATKGKTSPEKLIKISGEGLPSAIAVVSNTSVVKYSKASGWDDFSGGTLKISVDTQKNAGTYTGGYIRVYSGSTVEVKINFTVVIQEDGTGGETPGTNPDPDPTDTGVYVNPESLSFSVAQNATSPTKTIKVTGVNLTTDISVVSGTKYVTVTKGSDWNARTGGTLSVTVDTSRDPGTYEGGSMYIAVQSTTTYRKQIPVTVTITEPYTPPVVTPEISVNPESLSFEVIQGETSGAQTIKVVANNLEKDLSVNANTSDITVTKGSDWNARTGGTLSVTVKSSREAGVYESAYVAIASGDARKQVSVKYTVKNQPVTSGGTLEAAANTTWLTCKSANDDFMSQGYREATVTVTAKDISGDITASFSGDTNNEMSITPAKLGSEGGKFTVRYTPTVVRSGYVKPVLTVSAANATPVTITFNIIWDGSKPSTGGETPDPEPGQEVGPLKFEEKWSCSDAGGNLGSLGTARNLAFGNGKLYLGRGTDIVILDAYTGQERGTLAKGSVVTGSTYGVQYMNGKIYSCNLVTSATGEFRFYRWDGDVANPVLVFTDSSHGGLKRLGDTFTISGTDNDYWVTCAGGSSSSVLDYHVVNGSLKETKTITVTDANGSAQTLGSSPRAYRTNDGYRITSSNSLPTKHDSKGKSTGESIADPVTSGNDFVEFTYDDKNYLLLTSYLNNSTTLSNKTLTGGVMRLYDVSDGWKSATLCKDDNGNSHFPANGLGTSTRNTSFGTGVAVEQPNAGVVHAWVLTSTQGVAMYTSGKLSDTNSIVDVIADEDAPVEYYNLSGIRVRSENLAPGLYIRRQGNKATKVLVR